MKSLGLTAVTAAFLLPASLVKADALLFPYLVTSPTVASIVSIVNRDPSGELYLEYLRKITLAHDSECTSSGRSAVSSGTDDVVSFEANGEFVGTNPASVAGGPLFNDPATNVPYAGNDYTMGSAGITRAYLIADDNDNDGEDLYGEAIILETGGGAAWGYIAYNPAHDGGPATTTFDSSAAGIADTNDVQGEALDAGNNTDSAPVTILPSGEWVTRFFVTPLGDATQRGCQDCSVHVEMSRSGNDGADGMFDRDATPLAGSDAVNVVCISGVGIDELLPASVEAVVDVQGGFGYLDIDVGAGTTAQGTTSNTENAATVIKLEYNKPATQHVSPSASNSFSGTVNTAVWLRNRDTTESVGGF